MRNLSVKLFCIWTSSPQGNSVERYFLSRALELSVEQKHLCNFGSGHYYEHFCEIILNSHVWFRHGLKDILSRALAA